MIKTLIFSRNMMMKTNCLQVMENYVNIMKCPILIASFATLKRDFQFTLITLEVLLATGMIY